MSSARQCFLCKGRNLSLLFSLRDLPISHYLRKSRKDPDPRFSVGFECCGDCGLLQIVDPIPAELIYGEADTYTTGFQQPRHLEDLITTTIARQDPGKAIDIGCNDGALMEALRRAGYGSIVGVEPNPAAAELARKKGHKVYTSYLTKELAAQIVAECGEFDTIYLRHVVEHVSDLEVFFVAIRTLLRPDGFLVLELPDVEEGFALGSPAILWEEHVVYFTQPLAEYMLERFGFHIVERRRYVFGGGSLAFVAQKKTLLGTCTLRLPDASRTIELLHGFVADMERQKEEMRRSRLARPLERLSNPRLRRRAALLPAGFRLPDRGDGGSRGRRPGRHPSSIDAGNRPLRSSVGGGRRFAQGQAALLAGRRLGERVQGPRQDRSGRAGQPGLHQPVSAAQHPEKHRRGTARNHRQSEMKDSLGMSRIDPPLQPNGYKVQWSYLPKQFSAQNIEEILELFRQFVPTGDFTLGKPVREFEQKFAAMIGTRHAIGVNSGTDALKLSLKAVGVGPGDEVITTANTFIATVGAIGETYARPVFVDCTDNFCMDVSQVEARITKRTKALLPVHLAGQMTDMPALMKIAEKHGLPVVEDACQCILGNIGGKNSGTFGRSAGFSLHPLKNLNVWADGGMIVTDDDEFATLLRQLRNHGLKDRDSVVRMGCNSGSIRCRPWSAIG